MLPAGPEVLEISHAHRRSHGLPVNDSLSVALMERHDIRRLASADEDFLRVAGIVVHAPNDLGASAP